VSRRSPIAIVLLAALVSALVPSSAGAHTLTRTDGNDTKGSLDMAAVRSTHTKSSATFRITTHGAFTNGHINGENGFFEVDIDTNGDRKLDFIAGILFAAGKMRGVLLRANGSLVTRSLAAKRVSSKAVQVTVPFKKIGKPKSFDFAVFSFFAGSPCSENKPCIDSIPNRFPLLRQDLTAPIVKWRSVPTYSTESRATLAFDVAFSVIDDPHGSGVGRWTLQRRAVGSATWVNVKSGTDKKPTVTVTGDEGVTYQLRVLAQDKQGNKRFSTIERTTIPYDDANGVFDYQGAWTAATGQAGAFLGTLHAGGQDFELSFFVPGGKQLCLLGGTAEGDASASVTVNGTDRGTWTEGTGTAPRDVIGCKNVAGLGPTLDVTVTVTSAFALIVDGIVVVR
jgi:hypothetical protein